MTTKKTEAITGRDALARILAAIDAGAPCPDDIDHLSSGMDIYYHHQRRGERAAVDAAVMARALGYGQPHTRKQDSGVYSTTWPGPGYSSVKAFTTNEPQPEGEAEVTVGSEEAVDQQAVEQVRADLAQAAQAMPVDPVPPIVAELITGAEDLPQAGLALRRVRGRRSIGGM